MPNMTLMMSVSGVRGIIGSTMTPTLVAELGATFGNHVGGGRVVVGRDSRPSGPMVQAALVSGLLASGCEVIDLGIASTPATARMVIEQKATGGVIVTASHNPIEWNGIKFLTADGCAPPPEVAEKILARYREKRFNYSPVEKIGTIQWNDRAAGAHCKAVAELLDQGAIRRKDLSVVLDSVNGAGGGEGRMLLEQLGCKVVHLNAEPTGRFTHPPEPTKENLVNLCDAVKKHRADIGFAQDPDADRLAIVDETGRYIGEEYTLVLAAEFILSRTPGPIAANLSTSRMIDDVCKAVGGKATVHRSAVGEANVVQAMRQHGCVFGGEGNGGVIDPRVVNVRNSLASMGLVLNLLAEDGRPLSKVVDAMPAYVMLKKKFDLDRPTIDAWLKRIRASASGATLNDCDGLRLDWPEGWVHVRPSNTEPIARVIAEARDEATAEGLVRRMTELMK